MKPLFPDSIFPPSIFTFISNRSNASSKQFYSFNIVSVNQVHGDNVILLDEQNKENINMEADALITKMPDIALSIRTADCLPVFIYDSQGDSIGLVHAGWKGTQKKIVKKTIKMMREEWGVSFSDLQIAFGPAIRSCCYEVGKEFRQYFPLTCLEKNEKCFFDLISENKNQLMSLGVVEQNIFDSGVCTCCDEHYFSYRREGDNTGRIVSVIIKKQEK